MTTSDTIGVLAKHLAEVQHALPAIVKSGNNPAFRSKYMTLDTIVDVVRPLLAAKGIALVQGCKNPMTDDNFRPVGIVVETRLIHTSGEWIATETTIPLSKVDAHGMGSAISYGRRYGLCAMLAISADDDDDANDATGRMQQSANPLQRPITARINTNGINNR